MTFTIDAVRVALSAHEQPQVDSRHFLIAYTDRTELRLMSKSRYYGIVISWKKWPRVTENPPYFQLIVCLKCRPLLFANSCWHGTYRCRCFCKVKFQTSLHIDCTLWNIELLNNSICKQRLLGNTHYNDVIMGAMASQITNLTIVY